MDYNIISAAKMPDLVHQVNQAILEGWLPMEGGFQVQTFSESSTRYLQAMVKIYPWSIKSMQAVIGSAPPVAAKAEPMTLEAAPPVARKVEAKKVTATKSVSKKKEPVRKKKSKR